MDQQVIGNTVNVVFSSLCDNKEIECKVDTGATNSSLHAVNIKTNDNNNSVTFACPALSDNLITIDLCGSQDVVSADAGSQPRPIVKLDITINGLHLREVTFNLNDRSEMDCPVLIGQNILQAGKFIIDVNQDAESTESIKNESVEEKPKNRDENRDKKILHAIQVLKENNVTIYELVEFMRTAPLYLRNGEIDG